MRENKLYYGGINSGKTEKIKEEVKGLINGNKNIIILDTKKEYDELFQNTSYEILKFDVYDMQNSNEYNPFELVTKYYKENNIDMCMETINNIGEILYKSTPDQDPFWNKSANMLMNAICLYLLENNRDLNFKEIIKVSESEMDELKEYINNKDVLEPISMLASAIVNAPNETKGGILSVMRLKMGYIGGRTNLLSKICTDKDLVLKDKGQVIIFNNYDKASLVNEILEIMLLTLIEKIYLENKEFYIILDNYDTVVNKDNFEDIFNYCTSKNVSCIVGVRNKELVNTVDVFTNVIDM